MNKHPFATHHPILRHSREGGNPVPASVLRSGKPVVSLLTTVAHFNGYQQLSQPSDKRRPVIERPPSGREQRIASFSTAMPVRIRRRKLLMKNHLHR